MREISGNNPFQKLQKLISDEAEEIKKHAIEGYKEYANNIAEKASKYAPRDTGQLEKSLHVVTENSGEDGIILTVVADAEWDGKHYAKEAHEKLPPAQMAEWQLGEKSVDKAQELGVEVGGEYMDRAVIDTEFDLEKYIKEKMG